MGLIADNDLCNQTARYRRNPAKCYDFDTRVRFTNLYFTVDLYFTIVCKRWILFRLIPVHVYLDYYQVGALDCSKRGLLKIKDQNSKIYLFPYKISLFNNPYPSELKNNM